MAYTYDYARRMNTMKTWQTNGVDSSAATTTWNYDPQRGFLTNKVYQGGTGIIRYTNTSAGRLYSRTWARGTTTTYLMNAFGDIYRIGYSDGTPGATNSYDRLGRQTSVQDGTGTHLLSYDLAGRLLTETNTAGLLAGLGLANAFDSLGRRTSAGLYSNSSLLASTSFGYDAGSRLSGVTNGNVNVAYNYLANSPLVGQIISRQSGTTRMTTTKTYDYLNRLTRISSVPSASSVVSFDYAYNNANQRTTVTLGPDRSYWAYGYDTLGQVISGKKYWYDGVPFAGQQFEYTFDDIGNRKQTKAGGDSSGSNLRLASYTNNLLNQITGRQVPGSNDIIGIAHASATVTVNGQTPYRRGEYYRTELPATNAAMVAWQPVTNKAVLAGVTNTLTNSILTPCRGQPFWYDADGNLLSDGVWTNMWDGENRLVRMVSLMNNTLTNSWLTLSFAYDRQGRRVSKTVSNYTAGAWQLKSDQRFVYDGWNLLAILSSDLSLQSSFTWGSDLSGSMQGAGGVGGLLALNQATNGAYFLAYDGNGNVAALVNATNGTVTAQYEYGPFGEVLRASGSMAKANPVRFSTKYQDDDTDLFYYGYRYLNTSTGRWLSRDSSEEGGGMNLYGTVGNALVNVCDPFGLWGTDQHHALIDRWLELNPAPDNKDWSWYLWRPCIAVNVPARLKQGNDIVDGVGAGVGAACDAQASANSYKHSMRAWYESVASAKSKRDTFVKDFASLADDEASIARHLYGIGDRPAAERAINAAVVQVGKAQHPLADETSPPHAGFQPWYGISDGIAILGLDRYLIFVGNHHRRESATVYADAGDTPATTVAGQMHPTLLDVLR